MRSPDTDGSPVTTEPVATEPAPTPRSPRAMVLTIALAAVLALVVGGVITVQSRRNADAQEQLAARQAEVEQRGQHVMPFDQTLTTHQFAKNDSGGIETVTANDPRDSNQVALVQQHLEHERELFSAGDFSDPMAIHGHQMPGITDLQQGASSGQVTVSYEALPAGAQLTYTAKTPALVATVHAWFDAQLMDHGSHATG